MNVDLFTIKLGGFLKVNDAIMCYTELNALSNENFGSNFSGELGRGRASNLKSLWNKIWDDQDFWDMLKKTGYKKYSKDYVLQSILQFKSKDKSEAWNQDKSVKVKLLNKEDMDFYY